MVKNYINVDRIHDFLENKKCTNERQGYHSRASELS